MASMICSPVAPARRAALTWPSMHQALGDMSDRYRDELFSGPVEGAIGEYGFAELVKGIVGQWCQSVAFFGVGASGFGHGDIRHEHDLKVVGESGDETDDQPCG